MTDNNVVPFRGWRDSFYNLLSGLGVVGRDKFASQQYSYVPMSLQECETAYRGDWISRKCVDIPAYDMTREWRSWQADQDQIEAIENLEKDKQIQAKVLQCLIKARLYGGAIIIIGVDQGKPSEELKLDEVGEDDLKWLHVVPWHQLTTGPIIWDISSPYWAQPSWYMARTTMVSKSQTSTNLSSGTTQPLEMLQIHPSRVVRLLGLPPPDPLVQQWGDSILQPINDTVKSAGLVSGSLATLISELKIDVIKVPNLSEILSTDAGTAKITKRFSEANVAKSVINTILLDSSEEWQRVQANLSGVQDILSVYLQIASGAADIPASRFLGLPHKGLNTTGEADFRNYYDRLASDQAVWLTPAMNKLDQVIIRSALGDAPENVNYQWDSLWQTDDSEKAKNALTKAQAFKIDVDAGLIPTTALAQARINQLIEDNVYPGLDQALDDAAAAGDTVEEHNKPPPPPDPSALPPPADPSALPPPAGEAPALPPPSPSEPVQPAADHRPVNFYILRDDGEFSDYNEQHDPETGRFGTGEGGHPGSGKLNLKETKERAFTGKQDQTATKMSKQEAGKLGEAIAQEHLRAAGISDARALNTEKNNYAVDMAGDHQAIEVKTGQVSNSPTAQQWRVTLGESGKEEKAWLAKASPEDKAAHNAAKMEAAFNRKSEAVDKLSKSLGAEVRPRTVAVLLHPDKRIADVHEFDGFHQRIGWNSAQMKAGYVKSYSY